MVARLRLGNELDKRCGAIAENAVPQAFLAFTRSRAHAHVVKSIFTLARQYPHRRL
jgi:hypothetical protein